MPWITINLMAGTSPENKAELHKKVATAVREVLDIPSEWIKVQIVEMTEENHSIGGVQIKDIKTS